mgnify:CR=1 FL=1
MRQTRSIEIGVGLFMAAGLVALFFLAMQVSNLGSLSDDDGYVRPIATYSVDDHWTLEGGANWFFGDDEHTFFGQFEDNTNVYAAIRFSFAR